MKTVLASVVLALACSTALAQHRHYNHNHHHYHRHNHTQWLAPLIIGGVIGYAITRQPEVVVQPPLYMQPYQPRCYYTTIREYYTYNGQLVREVICQ
jgi:hypothetical protein